MTTNLAWHVAYTYPNAEKKMHERLAEKGVESFLPLQDRLSIRRDRKKMIKVPLFPSYVFVKVNNATIDKVRFCKGFASFVRFANHWATVSEDQIQMIRTVIASDMPYVLHPESYAKEGDYVKVSSGVLKGHLGRVKHIKQTKDKCQVVLQVDHTGYALAVELDSRCVQVLTPSEALVIV